MAGIVNVDAIESSGALHSQLLFSVIVPAFNYPDGLRACLAALSRQTLPASQFEVIVVDDGSETPLKQVVESCGRGIRVSYLRVPNGGPARARNQGARIAKGRVLAFTDHDCAPSPDWLCALRDHFSKNPECAAGGPKDNGLPENVYSSAYQLFSDYAEAWFRNVSGGSYFTTNNFAVPREAFLRLEGFNESMPFAQEDREFGARWADHGLCMSHAAGAKVAHSHHLKLSSFLRLHFRYGASAIDFHRARRETRASAKIRFQGLRFHAGLLAAPFARRSKRAVRMAALLAGAEGAYATGCLAALLSLR